MVTATSYMSPRVCISVARPNDSDAIALFVRRLSAALRRSGLLGAKEGFSVIARDRDAGVVVGQAIAVPAGDGIAEIALAVADAYENHQIGAHLIERAMAEAQRRGIEMLRAELSGHNSRMIDVFTWHGFAPIGNSIEQLYLSLDGSGVVSTAHAEPARR